MVKMSTQHQIMDSSLSLGRLEIKSGAGSQEHGLSGPINEKDVQVGLKTHLNGCVPLSHQVAGHKYGRDKAGMLQHPDGTVLKQLQPPPRGQREMQFYRKVYAEDSDDLLLLDLQHYLPKYYGTWSSPEAPTVLYLKLEDVTCKFNKPCIMDVKIGQRSYDPFASKEKKEQQIQKYPLMEEIGFLVQGMRIYQVTSDRYDTHDQYYGRRLGKDTIKDGVAKFFRNGKILRKDAVASSIQKVQKILQWFEGQSQLHFYASSLLFVYEGAPQLDGGGLVGNATLPAVAALKEGIPECNNNIGEVGSRENGHVAAALDQGLSNMYVLHQRGCGRDHRVDVCLPWTCAGQAPPEQPNGNSTRPDADGGRLECDSAKSCGEVEVRMIDFAHVFPSTTRDDGYIFGLKNLLSTLQQILNE
uniref:Kinase n=1 Tax=Paramormyrops kingsleyae TaxID=1676925 RepID=A0A3B3QYR1_9TELE|nr:inositol polyphosphate multikinase [Paramormyrops kingsleyae]